MTTPNQPEAVLTAQQAMTLVSNACQPLDTEVCPLDNSLHRVLRERITAPEDQPCFDRSSVDGYAVKVDDPETTFTIIDHIRAGEWKPRALERGQTVRVATGGALPCVGLQVLMKEDVILDGTTIKLSRRYHDLNIRFRGDDARKGQVLMQPGVVLNPGALALLAGIGHTPVTVTRLPRVFHAATGNEIVAPELTPQPGQIRDSNSILIRAFLNQSHIEPKQIRLPEDETTAGRQLSIDAVSQADVLLISGGASVGEHDFTRSLLEHLGYTIQICKTNTRPGKPMIFGTRGNAVAFGLPGNPLAHFVCLNLYVQAALNKLAGLPDRLSRHTGTLGVDLEDIDNPRETLWPSRVDYTSGTSTLMPLRWSNSGDLTCLTTANALALIPPNHERLAKDSAIPFFPIRFFS